ncbi:hypothetical protein [Amycolatopsis sp. 3B14]|uniref:hypothetical protein n=1 Tax=Amycolatopsis sp. 3B14 TaxID=3243600 RepID=UPI003D9980B7
MVRRLIERGINVKGYFVLGFPTETRDEIDTTVRLVHGLWNLADNRPGTFRASTFEYRPHPGKSWPPRVSRSARAQVRVVLPVPAGRSMATKAG